MLKSKNLISLNNILILIISFLLVSNAFAFGGGGHGRISSTRKAGVDAIGVHYDASDNDNTSNDNMNPSSQQPSSKPACSSGTSYCLEKDATGSCLATACCNKNVFVGKGINGADLCCEQSTIKCVEDNPDGSCAYCQCHIHACPSTHKHYCYRQDENGLCIGHGCCRIFTHVVHEGQCLENKCYEERLNNPNFPCITCDPLTGESEPNMTKNGTDCSINEDLGVCSNGICEFVSCAPCKDLIDGACIPKACVENNTCTPEQNKCTCVEGTGTIILTNDADLQSKMPLIRALKEIMGIGLAEAKALVDNLTAQEVRVKECISEEEAEPIIQTLIEAGGTAKYLTTD